MKNHTGLPPADGNDTSDLLDHMFALHGGWVDLRVIKCEHKLQSGSSHGYVTGTLAMPYVDVVPLDPDTLEVVRLELKPRIVIHRGDSSSALLTMSRPGGPLSIDATLCPSRFGGVMTTMREHDLLTETSPTRTKELELRLTGRIIVKTRVSNLGGFGVLIRDVSMNGRRL